MLQKMYNTDERKRAEGMHIDLELSYVLSVKFKYVKLKIVFHKSFL